MTAHLPPDLGAEERGLADWLWALSALGPVEPPRGLRERVLAAGEVRLGRLSLRASRWGWAAAVAAGLLVAFGLWSFERAAREAATAPRAERAWAVVEDQSLPLFHDLESFALLEESYRGDGAR